MGHYDSANCYLTSFCVASKHQRAQDKLFFPQGTDVSAFETMCRRQNVWLHVEGNALAGLILVKNERKACPTGDSMALTLGSWIGVPAVPFVTLYKVI